MGEVEKGNQENRESLHEHAQKVIFYDFYPTDNHNVFIHLPWAVAMDIKTFYLGNRAQISALVDKGRCRP